MRLSRFQSSASISSSDYFGRDEGGGSSQMGGADFDVSAGELMNKLSIQVCLPLEWHSFSGFAISLCFTCDEPSLHSHRGFVVWLRQRLIVEHPVQ